MIRLNEKLNITEEQKLEITNMLFTFIKKIRDEKDITKITADQITTWWLKYIEKPEWMNQKISDEIDFVAQVCEFINNYKDTIDNQEVQIYDLKYKEDEDTQNSRKFLEQISASKGIEIDVSNLTKEEILEKINKVFYINNECDTLGEMPENI